MTTSIAPNRQGHPDPIAWSIHSYVTQGLAAVLGAARSEWMRHRQADRFAGIGYGTHNELSGVA
jgi:hypothetical protein